MNTTLIFGVLLIVAGIAFAILAYALLLSRRETPAEGEEAPAAIDEAVIEDSQAETAPPAAAPAPPVGRPGPTPPIAGVAAISATAPQAKLPDPGTIQVATLLRDEVTGSLIIEVGARRYRRPDELRPTGDWDRVEAASRDLQRWITGTPLVKPADEARREEAGRSGSMLDQINRILDRKLTARPEMPQGIRLFPSPEGGVRVMIGLQSFPLDEVPDQEINRLIREAVSEWESLT
jgi:hypothetical protein